MTKLTSIDPTVCRMIAADIDAAMKQVAAKYGLSVKPTSGGKYTPTTYVPAKYEFACIAENGMVESMEARAFRTYATMYGLKPEDLGRTFTMRGETFKVTGLRTKAKTKPITAESRGKTYIMAAETVSIYLAKEARA